MRLKTFGLVFSGMMFWYCGGILSCPYLGKQIKIRKPSTSYQEADNYLGMAAITWPVTVPYFYLTEKKD